MRDLIKSRMYIYKYVNGKLQFQRAVTMIGIMGPMPENECALFSNNLITKVEGEEVYEVWFGHYLEAHPDSTSDLMLEAGITHKSVEPVSPIR